MKIILLLASLLAGQDSATTTRGLIPVWSSGDVPRLRYALELRDELRKRGRLCDHAEDWDRTLRAISEGAELIEMAPCHHDKKTRRTSYRVAARWLTERDYGSASVIEGSDRR